MVKSLYDENFRYTEEALNYSREIYSNFYPIFKKIIDEGFSPREISHLFKQEITDIELNFVLDKSGIEDISPEKMTHE